MMEIKDSGNRRKFETGAVRDVAEGKGRCDLLPLDIVATVMNDQILMEINRYVRKGNLQGLFSAIKLFVLNEFDGFETAILEVSKHFEAGAQKYSPRNWEQGIPLHCYIDSAVRHYLKFKRQDNDEPHNRAFLWNILCAAWTHQNRPELIDLPFAEEKNND